MSTLADRLPSRLLLKCCVSEEQGAGLEEAHLGDLDCGMGAMVEWRLGTNTASRRIVPRVCALLDQRTAQNELVMHVLACVCK